MDYKTQQTAVFSIIGMITAAVLVGSKFGLLPGIIAVLGVVLVLYLCGKIAM